jgi:carboxypeptidase C (cathepsin A)
MGGPTNSDQMTAITMNGIIFLGTAFSIGQEEAIPVEQSVLDLPSIAATCWYHSTEKRGSVQDVIEAAHEFSYKEYLPALFLGKRLAMEEKEKVIKQLVAFTGLSAQYFLEHQLRISRNEFIKKCMSGDEKELGLYDSRYLVPLNFQIDKLDPVADDAAMGRYTPAFVSVMNGLKKKKLGITLNMEYISIAFEDVNSKWDYKTEQSPHKYLESAMRRNPDLKLFFASGFYDLVTVLGYVRYIVSQSEFPKERVMVKEYNAGHMLYLGEESVRALEKDLREFILDASKRTDRH